MHVAGDDHHGLALIRLQQAEEALPLLRKIGPGLPAGEVGQQLDAGADDANVHVLPQLLLQPRPLCLAQQLRIGTQIGLVRPHLLSFAPGQLLWVAQGHQLAAVPAQVQQNHLHAPAFLAKGVRGVDAIGPRAPF